MFVGIKIKAEKITLGYIEPDGSFWPDAKLRFIKKHDSLQRAFTGHLISRGQSLSLDTNDTAGTPHGLSSQG